MPFAPKVVLGIVGVIGAGGAGLIYSMERTISASGFALKPTKYPWSHSGPMKAFEHSSIRRGYEVYKNVCSACHGLKFLPYRRMIGVCLTADEAKRDAAEILYNDGPDENGQMFTRPGRTTDCIKNPYDNTVLAELANNGAEPPDLSLMVLARKGGEDYIFSLLTSYCEAPAGVEVPEGNYFNPYFPGGNLAMAPPLYNEIFEYSDGTTATISQCAKDVVTFLSWVAMPELELRQRLWLKVTIGVLIVLSASHYMKKNKWGSLKNRIITYSQVATKPKRDIK